MSSEPGTASLASNPENMQSFEITRTPRRGGYRPGHGQHLPKEVPALAYGNRRSRPPGSIVRRLARNGSEVFIARWVVREPDGTRRQRSRSFPTEAAAERHLRIVESDRRAAEKKAQDLIRARAAKRALANFVEEADFALPLGETPDLIEMIAGLPHDLRHAIRPDVEPDRAASLIEAFTAVCRTMVQIAHDSIAAREVAASALETLHEQIASGLEGMASVRGGSFLDQPQGFFVYCLWGDDTTSPLYVGQSGNLLARLGHHFGDRTKCSTIRRVTLIRCATKQLMDSTETRLIKRHNPPWNSIGVIGIPRIKGGIHG